MDSNDNLIRDKNGCASHVVFEWAGLALFVWFAFTGLLLWRPGYFAWSLLTGGVLLLWTLLMFDDIARSVNRVRGNAVYWIIFGLCAILAGHLLADQYLPQVETSKLSGSINISMCFHLILIAGGIMLAQRIGDIPSLSRIFPDILAVLMALGGGITAAVASNGPGRDTLWLISASGICIWLIPFVRVFSINTGVNIPFSDLTPPTKVKILLRLFAACCMSILLLVIANLFCLSVIAGCAIIVGLLYISAKMSKPIVCWAVAGLGSAGAVGIFLLLAGGSPLAGGIFGMGEKGFSLVFGGSSGLSILFATTGYIGVVLVLFGVGVIAASGLIQAKRAAPGRLVISAIWILATFIATAAFLARGGYVSPASLIALAVTWGLWPKVIGGKAIKERSGWILLTVVFSLLGLVASVKNPGLLGAMGAIYGLKDKGQHFIAGFLVTIVIVWVMGRRHWWLGAIGLGLGAMSGGVAEFMQKEFFKGRTGEMADWKAHLWGSAVAGGIFIIGICYRYAMEMTQRGGRKRKRMGRVLILILRPLVLLSILAFAAWWSWSVCKAIDHRWKMQRPTMTVSDVLMVPAEKSFHIPGTTNDKTVIITNSVLTAIQGRNNPEFGWQSDYKNFLRVMPKLSGIQPGITKPWFKGWPFGPLAYVQERGIVSCIEIGQPILAIDARDAEHWRKKSLETFRALLNGRPQRQAVVFVHPGPKLKFRQDRKSLRAVFPDIPCVCDVTIGSGANRTIGLLKKFLAYKGKPLPPTGVITSDINFAKLFRRHFGKACKVDIIDSKPSITKPKKKQKSNNWLNYYPDLKTFVDQQQ